MKRCKYVDKPCKDRYFSSGRGIYKCRLDEWKEKKKVCPYDNSIRSCTARAKGQKEL